MDNSSEKKEKRKIHTQIPKLTRTFRKKPKLFTNIVRYLEDPKWLNSMPQHRQKVM